MEIKITKDNFEEQVVKSDIPVLLDFWATWCGPCMMLSPIVEEIADEFDGTVTVGKINVDEEPELANAFGIESIPTLVIIKNGKIQTTSVGFKTKEQLEQMLKN